MSIIRVGVLRGGTSREYEVSIKSGKHILDMLKDEPLCRTYKGVDIFVDKEGVWHIDGIPQTPEGAIKKVDVIFNTMRGDYGGDGKLQRVLEAFSVPFVGTKSYGASLAQNKGLAKEHFKKNGIKTPYYKELNLDIGQNLHPVATDLFRTFPMPVVVKPKGQGSSLGVSYASNVDELVKALDYARGFSPEILVEEYLTGKEIISGFLDDFRGQDLYHLFPVEVRKPMMSRPEEDMATLDVKPEDLSIEEQELIGADPVGRKSGVGQYSTSPLDEKIFDWSTKHSGQYDHEVPAKISEADKQTIQDAVAKIREVLGLRHFATADFIVHPRRGVYLLEVNTYPGMHEHSPIYNSIEASGIKRHEFLEHLIKLALGGEK